MERAEENAFVGSLYIWGRCREERKYEHKLK